MDWTDGAPELPLNRKLFNPPQEKERRWYSQEWEDQLRAWWAEWDAAKRLAHAKSKASAKVSSRRWKPGSLKAKRHNAAKRYDRLIDSLLMET